MVTEIVEPRAQELLTLVHDDLRRAGFDRAIPAGLILGGGGSRLAGLVELSDREFSLPVRLAAVRGLPGLPESFAQPEYGAGVGLLMYGAKMRRQAAQKPVGLVGKFKAMFAGH